MTASTKTRWPALDGLRGLAILLVLIWHYAAGPAEPTSGTVAALLLQPFQIAWSGVDLFFVLSGFLIGGILLDHRKSPRYFKTFYIRRTCRIFPLYYLWIGLWLLIPVTLKYFQLGVDEDIFGDSSQPWPYLLFVQNFAMADGHYWGPHWVSVTWSLAIEEQFYIVLPLLIRLTPPRVLPWVLGGLVALAVVLRQTWYGSAAPGMYGYLLLPCRADALLLGVLCAWAIRQPEIRSAMIRSRHLLSAAGVVLASGMVALAYGSPNGLSPVMNIYGFTWIALFYAVLLLLVVLKPDGQTAKVFRFAPLRHLGTIAFGVYLIHKTVWQAIVNLTWHLSPPFFYAAGRAGVSLIALIATLALAQLVWVFYEKKFIEEGHSYKY